MLYSVGVFVVFNTIGTVSYCQEATVLFSVRSIVVALSLLSS